MCWEVTPRCTLLNLLAEMEEGVPLDVLVDFKDKLLELAEEEYLYVDISRSALYFALESCPEFNFDYENDLVKRSPEHTGFFDERFLDKTVNRRFTEKIRIAIHAACKSISKTCVSA